MAINIGAWSCKQVVITLCGVAGGCNIVAMLCGVADRCNIVAMLRGIAGNIVFKDEILNYIPNYL